MNLGTHGTAVQKYVLVRTGLYQNRELLMSPSWAYYRMRYCSTYLNQHPWLSFQSRTPWIILILTPLVSFPSGNLLCGPTLLPTPMSIPRLFVPSTHRLLGIIARRFLTAAARTFIHGCSLGPEKGQVAFSQPTGSGQAVMEVRGKGSIRIYEDWKCSND